MAPHALEQASPCQACGACCAYSADWPRATLESEAELEAIPARYFDLARGRMRCIGERCSALVGSVGKATACAVYPLRPLVCRDCQPGDEACGLARVRYGLPALPWRESEG